MNISIYGKARMKGACRCVSAWALLAPPKPFYLGEVPKGNDRLCTRPNRGLKVLWRVPYTRISEPSFVVTNKANFTGKRCC